MRSGIGPAAHLRVDRDRAAHRPAGRREPDRSPADRRRLRLEAPDLAPALHGHRVLRLRPASCTDRDAPDVEISFAKEMNFAPPTDDGLPRYTIIPGITQPRSRGTVTAPVGEPERSSGHRPVLSHRPGGSADADREGPHVTRRSARPTRSPSGTTASSFPAPESSRMREICGLHRGVDRHVVPSRSGRAGWAVGDDAVVDPKLASARHQRAARRRRVDHAGHRVGQHQRRLDDDRLARRRPASRLNRQASFKSLRV